LPTLLITQAEKYSTIVALSVIVVTDFWTSQVECPHPPPSKPIVMEIESKQTAATNYCKLLKYFRFVFGIYRYFCERFRGHGRGERVENCKLDGNVKAFPADVSINKKTHPNRRPCS